MSVHVPPGKPIQVVEHCGYTIEVYEDGTVLIRDPEGTPIANADTIEAAEHYIDGLIPRRRM